MWVLESVWRGNGSSLSELTLNTSTAHPQCSDVALHRGLTTELVPCQVPGDRKKWCMHVCVHVCVCVCVCVCVHSYVLCDEEIQ